MATTRLRPDLTPVSKLKPLQNLSGTPDRDQGSPERETNLTSLWGLGGRVTAAPPLGRRAHSPLALAGVQDELLVAAGADRQLVLRGVEDIQEQVALPGAAQKTGKE